jgi:radical SAM superfamily enzyme YgiQ (UPF0313 family)
VQAELASRCDLSRPRPLRIILPILLSGDLVLTPEHLGPAYLTAVLRQAGALAAIDDSDAAHLDALLDRVAAFAPDIVGLSLTMVSLDEARTFGRALRERLGPDVFIVAGGPVATHLGARLLRTNGLEFVDALIRGEGEVPLLRLCEALHGGTSLDEVPNLCVRRGTEVQQTAMLPGISNLDALPFPARDQFEMHGGRLPYMRVSTSRGCTAHCTFCNAPHARNRVGPAIKAWRGASPERVVDEIEMLVSTYGANTFDFVDSTFEDPGGGRIGKERVARIAKLILERRLHIYFNICMQAVNWTDADRPLIALLRRAGLEKVLIGVESGSERGLARWQKKSTVADNDRAIALLREAGIYVAFGFIMFHPWSTFHEVRENQAFLHRNFGHNLRRFTTRLELYPGAEVLQELEAELLLDEDFQQTLNPYGFRFVDPRIERLSGALNALYGSDYQERGAIPDEPAVFRFETYDIVVHNFLNRLRRLYGEMPAASETLEEFASAADAERISLANYNYALLGELTDLADRDRIDDHQVQVHAAPTETVFREAMSRIDRSKLICARRLRRLGCDPAAIAMTRPLELVHR